MIQFGERYWLIVLVKGGHMLDKLYFAHPVNVYNTSLENILLQRIKKVFISWEWEIVNPAAEEHCVQYEEWKKRTNNGMAYFTEVVLPNCHGCVFLGFQDGKIGAGVYKEIKFFFDNKLPVWEIFPSEFICKLRDISDISKWRILNIEDTKVRVRDKDGKTLPY